MNVSTTLHSLHRPFALTYCVTAVVLEPVLNELVEEAGLPRPRRPDHQELEQVVVRLVHST